MNNWLRLVLFLFICIPLRLVLAYLPSVLNPIYMGYLSVVVGLMAFGTLYLAFTNSRLHAAEGGGVTWWAPYRFVHGMLLLTAFIYLYRKDRNASIPLLMDVLFGIVLFFVLRVLKK